MHNSRSRFIGLFRSVRAAPPALLASRRGFPLLPLFIGLAALATGLLVIPWIVQAQAQEVTPTAAATGESPPAKPTNLQASAEHDSVTLAWTASTDQTVTHYAILRRNRDTDATGVFHVIDSNAGPGTSYDDNSVAAESKYNYRAKAVSPTGVSQWSGYVKAETPAAPEPTPAPTPIPTSTPEPDPEPETDPADLAPTGLTAALAEGGGVAMSWTAPAEDADSVTGYEILRAVGDGEMTTLAADTGNTATAYTDATATDAGETYAYQVKAIRGEDRSQASGQAQVQLPHDPEDLRPTGLTVSLVDNRVTLSWVAPKEDADSVDGYEILRRRPYEGETTLATLVADTESTATTYTDATANEAGVVYVYRVKALRGSEASLWSNFARIELPSDYEAPTDTPTVTPTGLTPATLENTLLGYSEEEEAGTLEPNEVTFDEGATFRVTVVSAWPGSLGLVLMLTAGASAQDAALADKDFILEADETVLIVGTTEFSFDDATLSHSDTTGDNGEYTGLVVATWADGEPGLAAGETVAFLLGHRDRPEEAQFSTHETTVPLNWDLKPSGLVAGDEFRLLFLTGTTFPPTSTDIEDYNAYAQGDLNEFAHGAIRPYSSGFRVVGSTADDDARDNTSTTYTSTNMGLPIYWLGGSKVADDYADFYDGGWDDEANPRHRGGIVRFPTNGLVWTGSNSDGREKILSLSGSYGLGENPVSVGWLNSNTGEPLDASAASNEATFYVNTLVAYPYYALSQVFTVGNVANSAPVFTDTAPAARSIAENPGSGTNVGAPVAATDVDTGDTLVYSLGGTDAESFSIVSTSGQIRTKSGVAYNFEAKSSYSVVVTVTDGTHTLDDTATIAVTISLTDVNEPPSAPNAPTVRDVEGMNDRLNVSWNAPRNTGPAITDYDVQHRVGQSGPWTDLSHTGTGLSATITGLSASDIYDVRVQVRATNPEGTGEWSKSGRAPKFLNICGRSWWVRNKIVELTPKDDTCSDVDENELEVITELDFNGNGGAHLREGDFEGLTGLVTLDLGNIGIGSIDYHSGDGVSQRLKGGLFDGLTSLETLNLSNNRFYPRIDDDAFDGLGDLTELDVRGFSRNPQGTNSNHHFQCWSDEEKAQTREKYPWNPRLGSPLAFDGLTSLVTYNFDADFDTHVSGYDYTPRAYATNNYTQPPDEPLSLSKSVSGDNEVTISWSAPSGVSGITGYIIERSVNNLGAFKYTCRDVYYHFSWHDALGDEVGRPTATSFTDDIGASDLLNPGRTIRSLKYHVYTVANGARSMPATIEVGALQRGRQ